MREGRGKGGLGGSGDQFGRCPASPHRDLYDIIVRGTRERGNIFPFPVGFLSYVRD